MEYNTNDLIRARYSYNYTTSNGIEVNGQRDGVLYFKDDIYVDLITSNLVNEEDIIRKQSFSARDNEINLDSIIKIFEGLEDYYENMATERQISNISSDIPTVINFKASEMNHALESMIPVTKPSKFKIFSLFRK